MTVSTCQQLTGVRCVLCRAVLCRVLFAAGELIQSLLAQEQAAVVDVLAQQPEQPDMQRELIKRIQL